MSIYKKLLEIQKSVDQMIKDSKNLSDKYDFASDENVLDKFRPLMDERSLLLIPVVKSARVHAGETRSGTARFLTELDMEMIWHDCETDEELRVGWYAQGVDLAGEKGVGKAQTYAEKYFLLKFFHVPTKKDDPDASKRTRSGELSQQGTAAALETAEHCRKQIPGIVKAIYGIADEALPEKLVQLTKNDARGYAGVDDVAKLSDTQSKVFYGKLKALYRKKTGKDFSDAGD